MDINNNNVIAYAIKLVILASATCVNVPALAQQSFGRHLPSNNIKDIVQDHNRIIWAATDDGLAKYQHGIWEVFTKYNSDISSNDLNDLHIAQDGTLWIATDDAGVATFKDGIWENYNYKNSKLPLDHAVGITETKDGAIWITTVHGLLSAGMVRIHNGNWSVFNENSGHLPSDFIYTVYESSDGALWIGTYKGLVKYHNNKWQTFDSKEHLYGDMVTHITETTKNEIWIISRKSAFDRSLSRLKDGQWQHFNASNSIVPEGSIYNLKPMSDGSLWVGVPQGIIKIKDKLEMHTLNTSVYKIVQTDNGTIWAGTRNGVIRFQNDKITHFNKSTGHFPAYAVPQVFPVSNNEIWFATTGLVQYTNNNWNIFQQYRDILPGYQVNCLEVSHDGKLFVGTENGYMVHHKGKWTRGEMPIIKNVITPGVKAILTQENGTVWIGTSYGLIKVEKNKSIIYNEEKSPLPFNLVTSIKQDKKNNIWVSTRKGLARLNGADWEIYNKENNQLPDNDVQGIEISKDGTVWVATRRGISQYSNNKWKIYSIRSFDYPPGQVIHSIASFSNQTLAASLIGIGELEDDYWYKTYTNVFEYNRLNLELNEIHCTQDTLFIGTNSAGYAFLKGDKWQYVNRSNSIIPSNDIKAFAQTPDGAIWVGTKKGLVKYHEGKYTIIQ